MASNLKTLVDTHPLTAPVLADDCNEAEFVKDVLHRRAVENTQTQLNQGVQALSSELGGKVSENYETLLSNVHATHLIETKLLRSNERVEALAQAVRRVRAASAKPYARLESCVLQLERMQESAELLRQAQRAVMLCKRLHESIDVLPRAPPAGQTSQAAATTPSAAVGASKRAERGSSGGGSARRADLPKAAAALCELEALLASSDLGGLDVIDTELPYVREQGQAVRSQAALMLQAGVDEQSPAQAAYALQVFFHLGELRERTLHAADAVAATVRAAAAAAIDPATFGADAAQRLAGGGGVLGDLGAVSASRNGMPPASAERAWRDLFWVRADALGEALFTATLRLSALERLLLKKRDPLSHTLFASLFETGGGDPAESVAVEGATPITTGQHAAAPPAPQAGGRWGGAVPSMLSAGPLLASIVDAFTAEAASAALQPPPTGSAANDGQSPAGNGRSSATAAASSLDAASRSTADSAVAGGGDGLAGLWLPLLEALRGALTITSATAPFVRHMLATGLPRLLQTLTAARERATGHLQPSSLPPAALRHLDTAALLACIDDTGRTFHRELTSALRAEMDSLLAPLIAGTLPPASAAPSTAQSGLAAVASERRLGKTIHTRLHEASSHPPLQAMVVGACATAVEECARRIGRLLRTESAEAGEAASATLNGHLLALIQSLRADVCGAIDDCVSAELAPPLRRALSELHPAISTLANPATPLPEEMRVEATVMLKQQLRREMIDEVGAT